MENKINILILVKLLLVSIVLLSGCTDPVYDRYNNLNTSIRDKVRYQTDIKSHGVKDYWQSPKETLKLGTGDCEDFAILQAYILHEKYNLPEDSIKYGYYKNSIEEHMVIVVDNKYILDYDGVYDFRAFHKSFYFVSLFDYNNSRTSNLYNKGI